MGAEAKIRLVTTRIGWQTMLRRLEKPMRGVPADPVLVEPLRERLDAATATGAAPFDEVGIELASQDEWIALISKLSPDLHRPWGSSSPGRPNQASWTADMVERHRSNAEWSDAPESESATMWREAVLAAHEDAVGAWAVENCAQEDGRAPAPRTHEPFGGDASGKPSPWSFDAVPQVDRDTAMLDLGRITEEQAPVLREALDQILSRAEHDPDWAEDAAFAGTAIAALDAGPGSGAAPVPANGDQLRSVMGRIEVDPAFRAEGHAALGAGRDPMRAPCADALASDHCVRAELSVKRPIRRLSNHAYF